MEEHLVVLGDRHVDIPLDLEADLDDPAANCRDLGLVGKYNPAPRGLAVFIFADQDPHSERLNKLVHDAHVLVTGPRRVAAVGCR